MFTGCGEAANFTVDLQRPSKRQRLTAEFSSSFVANCSESSHDHEGTDLANVNECESKQQPLDSLDDHRDTRRHADFLPSLKAAWQSHTAQTQRPAAEQQLSAIYTQQHVGVTTRHDDSPQLHMTRLSPFAHKEYVYSADSSSSAAIDDNMSVQHQRLRTAFAGRSDLHTTPDFQAFEQKSDFVTLAKMAQILRPKFNFTDHTSSADSAKYDLFNRMICNAAHHEQLAEAYDQAVVVPAQSNFMLGDIRHIKRLVHGMSPA